MSLQTKTKIYDVYKMYHSDGTFMCYVNEKRAKWYAKRDLTEWISEHEFKLKFEPEGYGKAHLDYYNQKLENQCVCCGLSGENGGLTRHHVVPYVFRSRFPVAYKESNHFDILPLCVECHEGYEESAMAFKKEILKQHNTSVFTKISPEKAYNNKIKMAQEVLEKEKLGLLKKNSGEDGSLPASRRAVLESLANKPYLKEPEINDFMDGWSVVAANVLKEDKLFEFVKSWRQHFLDHAKPKYLPNYWVVDHPLESSEKSSRNSVRKR